MWHTWERPSSHSNPICFCELVRSYCHPYLRGFHTSFLNIYLLFIYFYVWWICKHVWACVCQVCIWSSEDNLWKLGVFFHHMGPGIELRSSYLPTSHWLLTAVVSNNSMPFPCLLWCVWWGGGWEGCSLCYESLLIYPSLFVKLVGRS